MKKDHGRRTRGTRRERLWHWVKHEKGYLVLGGIVGFLVLVQLLASPVAEHFTRKALREMEGFRGSVDDVSASVFPPRYELDGLELWDRADKAAKEPLARVGHLELSVAWRKLLRGSIVARAWIHEPALTVVQRSQKAEAPQNAQKKAEALPELAERLEEMAPLKVDAIDVTDGTLLFQDNTERKNPEIRLSKLDASMVNLATRAALAGGEPTRLHATGRLQKTGKLSVEASADPFAKELAFDVEAKLLDFQLAEVAQMAEAKAGMHPSQGTLDLFVNVKAREGNLHGGIKPILKGVEIKTAQAGILDKLKAWVGDKSIDVLSDERDRNATIIPIRGTIENAVPQTWPTIFGVLRNAFVEGISSGFTHLPPREAPAKEGILEQAVQAFTGEEPPEAQPETGEERKEAQADKEKREAKKEEEKKEEEKKRDDGKKAQGRRSPKES